MYSKVQYSIVHTLVIRMVGKNLEIPGGARVIGKARGSQRDVVYLG